MEIVVVVVVIIVVVAVLSRSPMIRRSGDAEEHEWRSRAPGADVDKQFKRPPDEGGLL